MLLELVKCSLKEDGCLHYKLFENINDEFQFTFIEIWTNEDAFENHLQSDHVRTVSFSINDDIAKVPAIKRYKSLQPDSNKMNSRTTSRFCVLL